MAASQQVLTENGENLISEDGVELIFTEGTAPGSGPALIVQGLFTLTQGDWAEAKITQADAGTLTLTQADDGRFTLT